MTDSRNISVISMNGHSYFFPSNNRHFEFESHRQQIQMFDVILLLSVYGSFLLVRNVQEGI